MEINKLLHDLDVHVQCIKLNTPKAQKGVKEAVLRLKKNARACKQILTLIFQYFNIEEK